MVGEARGKGKVDGVIKTDQEGAVKSGGEGTILY